MPEPDVQDALRRAMTRWGRPGALRVDNGSPWGTWSDLPTCWALWVVGLGIRMIWNDPYKPQHNGVVERSHSTAQGWVEVERCAGVADLQARLDEADEIQREHHESDHGHTRRELFAALWENPSRFDEAWEGANWDGREALDHLAGYRVARRVDKGGKASVYNRNLYVGIRQAGKTVWVELDPLTREWVISDEAGIQTRRIRAEEVTHEAIRLLELKGPK